MPYIKPTGKLKKRVKTDKEKGRLKEKVKKKKDQDAEQKKKKIIQRKIAGYIWEDPTLLDWPENDFRLFIGNLGNEVTDLVLSNTFRRYNSFYKARVIRDKRSQKTKGYGFVSFTEQADYIKAYMEMNGKYIGNRPCKITASKWRERTSEGYEQKI